MWQQLERMVNAHSADVVTVMLPPCPDALAL
jgi:hypothetical protein